MKRCVTAVTPKKFTGDARTRPSAASISPSVHSVYAVSPNLRGALFLAISQSGRSPDLLRNAEAARA